MTISTIGPEQVTSNGATVWAHAMDGSCVGRFSAFGIDVHRTVSEQMAGMSECLDCTHELPGMPEWERFKAGMLEHHGIVVGDQHQPGFLTEANPSGIAALMARIDRLSRV